MKLETGGVIKMTKDEAIIMAIEALEEAKEQLGGLPQLDKLIQDCKEALEQKEYNVINWRNKMNYKIVPTSPDLIQVNAGIKALEKSNGDTLESEIREVYKAMLELCPDVSSESGDLLKHFGVE
jgi:hypothetical protein